MDDFVRENIKNYDPNNNDPIEGFARNFYKLMMSGDEKIDEAAFNYPNMVSSSLDMFVAIAVFSIFYLVLTFQLAFDSVAGVFCILKRQLRGL